jgi:hypothetical protein
MLPQGVFPIFPRHGVMNPRRNINQFLIILWNPSIRMWRRNGEIYFVDINRPNLWKVHVSSYPFDLFIWWFWDYVHDYV